MSLVFWIFIIFLKEADAVYSATSATAIRSKILNETYDAISRPVAQTEVKVSLNLLSIDEVDMKSQKLTSAGWLTFEWKDHRLAWTPASYDNIEYVFASPSTIWKPELVIANSLEGLGVINDSNLQLRIKFDGTVDWEPPLLFKTFCQVDITYYPHDKQKCAIKVASWGYVFSEIKLDKLRTDVNLEDYEQNGEWIITRSEVGTSNITEPSADGNETYIFPQLLFWIYMDRRTEFYNLNVMLPILLTSMLITLVFIVPVESGEKVSFILTILLTLAVFLTVTADALPPTSITTSILGVYLGTVLLLAALAILLTVFIIILHHKDGAPAPTSCMVQISRFAASITCSKTNSLNRPCLSKVRPKSAVSHESDADSVKDLNQETTWSEISIILADAVYSAASETTIRSNTVLAASYDAISRPVAQTVVSVSLNLLAIDELDMKSQKLTSAGWLTFEWEDPRLTWTPASNDDIEYIFATPSTIWKPELVIDNSLEGLGIIADSNLQLRIKFDGTVDWEPPLLFTTFCQVDVTYYPYDKQKCAIEVVSWGYVFSEIKLDHLRTDVNLEDFEQHGEWVVTRSELGISNITETSADGTETHIFPQLLFWIYMDRRTEFYNLNVMMPILLTSLLMTLVFIVPVDSGEKISFILTILLTLAVFLTITADALPPTSITTSILGVYLGTVLLLAALAVLLTVFIIILHHKDGEPAPTSCMVPISRFAASITCSKTNSLSRPSSSKVRPKSAISRESDADSVKDFNQETTWSEISIILDKFFFVFFLIMSVIVNVIYLLVLIVGGQHSDP